MHGDIFVVYKLVGGADQEMDADVPWQNFVYFAITVPSLPLYLLILGTIIHRRVNRIRFTTTFYALLISLVRVSIFYSKNVEFS